MFDALLMYFGMQEFWMIVTAVMVGVIFIRAVPYVIVAMAYVLGLLGYLVGIVVGVGLGIVNLGINAVRNIGKKE